MMFIFLGGIPDRPVVDSFNAVMFILYTSHVKLAFLRRYDPDGLTFAQREKAEREGRGAKGGQRRPSEAHSQNSVAAWKERSVSESLEVRCERPGEVQDPL